MTQEELWIILAIPVTVVLVAIDRWTRFRAPRRKPRPRVDPRKTWALEHELEIFSEGSPERIVELFNHGLGCAECAAIRKLSAPPVAPRYLNGPIVEHGQRFSTTGMPVPGARLRACACQNITSNESGICGVCEMSLLTRPR